MNFDQYNPESITVLWEGSPSDATSIATRGRINTAGYKLTTDALRFASGVISNREENIPLWAIRDVDILQTMSQKARSVTDVRLVLDPQYRSSFGQQVVMLRSIKDGRHVRDMILSQANVVRRYWADHQQQRTVEANRAGASNIEVSAPAAAAPDMMAQLTRLGEMKSAGLLTDDEFSAAKAKLLGI